MELKHNINSFMRIRGMSVKDLSIKSGVPVRTIEDIRKRNDCRLSTIKKLAKALGTSIDVLAGGKVSFQISIDQDNSED